MNEARKLAAILAADVAGYSRLASADEERTLARLRALRSDLIDPAISVHHGRVVKRTGDGILIEFRSVVDAVRCAIEVQNGMVERNAGLPRDRRIEFRVGIHLGDVVEESDGDLMGDGVNIAARLEGIADPGGINVSEDAYRQVRDRIGEAFVDLGEKELKNIARPVHVYRIDLARTPTPPGPDPEVRQQETSPRLVKMVSTAPRLSIVVLPFANLSGDPEQEYFVDGVTESLTTDLSRISGSFVIARNTAFTFKGKPIDVKQIGRDLNVRYALEGSVQRGGGRMRVNVQLIDAETGNHLWAERFDKPIADLFDMQDEIVARLARQLDSQLIAAEARRAAHSPHPDFMDLYFQGTACWHKGINPEYLTQARSYFERAISLDPGNIEALVGMAWVDEMSAAALMSADQAERHSAAEAGAAQALLRVPHHAFAHFVLGVAYAFTSRGEDGVKELERALALDRNLAAAHGALGIAKVRLGRPEETEAHVREALRLSPNDTLAYLWMLNASVAAALLGDEEGAVVWSRRSIEANRSYPFVYFRLGAGLARLGRVEEARQAVRTGLSLDPGYTVARFRATVATMHVSEESVIRTIEAMRLAGVPEG